VLLDKGIKGQRICPCERYFYAFTGDLTVEGIVFSSWTCILRQRVVC